MVILFIHPGPVGNVIALEVKLDRRNHMLWTNPLVGQKSLLKVPVQRLKVQYVKFTTISNSLIIRLFPRPRKKKQPVIQKISKL